MIDSDEKVDNESEAAKKAEIKELMKDVPEKIEAFLNDAVALESTTDTDGLNERIMKKFLLILTLALLAGFSSKAQNDDNDKIRDKMREFIQKRLDLTRNEAERFTSVFIRYFRESETNPTRKQS